MFFNDNDQFYRRFGTLHNPLFVVLTGSHLYGTDNENSDRDYRGVYANTPTALFGLHEENRSIEMTNAENDDIAFWSIRHFLRMSVNNNPNVIEVLFAPDSHFKYLTHDTKLINLLEELRGEKNRFLTSAIISSAISFARNELLEASAGAGIKLNKDLNPEVFYTPPADKTKTNKKLAHVLRLLDRVSQIMNTATFSPVLEGDVLNRIRKVRQGEWNYTQILEEFKRYQRSEQAIIRLTRFSDPVKSLEWANDWLIRFNTERIVR